MPIRAGVAPEAKIQGRGDGAGSEESAVAEPSACRSLTGLSGGGFFFFASDPVFRRKLSLQDLRATIPESVDPQHPLVVPLFGCISLFESKSSLSWDTPKLCEDDQLTRALEKLKRFLVKYRS